MAESLLLQLQRVAREFIPINYTTMDAETTQATQHAITDAIRELKIAASQPPPNPCRKLPCFSYGSSVATLFATGIILLLGGAASFTPLIIGTAATFATLTLLLLIVAKVSALYLQKTDNAHREAQFESIRSDLDALAKSYNRGQSRLDGLTASLYLGNFTKSYAEAAEQDPDQRHYFFILALWSELQRQKTLPNCGFEREKREEFFALRGLQKAVSG